MAGGRFTPGVVRVDDTVRRPATAASPFIARLQNHLEASGFAGCPRHLGWDDRGRDVLTYLDGTVEPRWRRFTDDQIAAAARLLRELHDATRRPGLDVAGHSLELATGQPPTPPVICHHDPAPNNAIFRDGRPVAFIDFDFAAPGDPIEDVAYVAWSWCVSSRPDRGPVADQARQVRVVADAYRLADRDRTALPSAIVARQRRNVAFWQRRLRPEAGQDLRDRAIEVIAWTRREIAFTARHRAAFVAGLVGALS